MSKRLDLTVQYVSKTPWVPERSEIRQWVRAALNADPVNGIRGGRITIRFVDDDEGRNLNKTYRHKDYPTNVLTFCYDDLPAETGAPRVCGDLVITPAVCANEATTQGKTNRAHMAHLIIHGTLHLLGLDHNDETTAKEMESIERRLLATMRYPDPYTVNSHR